MFLEKMTVDDFLSMWKEDVNFPNDNVALKDLKNDEQIAIFMTENALANMIDHRLYLRDKLTTPIMLEYEFLFYLTCQDNIKKKTIVKIQQKLLKSIGNPFWTSKDIELAF